MLGKNMKVVTYCLFVFSGLPLVAYPAILLAGIMSLAGERSGGAPLLLSTVATACQIGSIAYPAIYFPFLQRAKKQMKDKQDKAAFRSSLIPPGYLLALGLLFAAWFGLDDGA
jgi:amino acid permease